MMLSVSEIRRRVALFICPELRPSVISDEKRDRAPSVIDALLTLCDAFQARTALSDWELAAKAGVNNRAIKILRSGSPVSDKTAARLFEYFEEMWPKSVAWPLDDQTTARFGTILTIPVIELLGGHEAMLALIRESGRKRSKDAVRSWARRSGMPGYARELARSECQLRGIPLKATDFEPARLTPAQIDRLRTRPTPNKEAA